MERLLFLLRFIRQYCTKMMSASTAMAGPMENQNEIT
jgi:hypothetical protein